jgi:hypothetical protein
MAVSAIQEQRDSMCGRAAFILRRFSTNSCVLLVIVSTIRGITRGDVSLLSPNHTIHAKSRHSGKC